MEDRPFTTTLAYLNLTCMLIATIYSMVFLIYYVIQLLWIFWFHRQSSQSNFVVWQMYLLELCSFWAVLHGLLSSFLLFIIRFICKKYCPRLNRPEFLQAASLPLVRPVLHDVWNLVWDCWVVCLASSVAIAVFRLYNIEQMADIYSGLQLVVSPFCVPRSKKEKSVTLSIVEAQHDI